MRLFGGWSLCIWLALWSYSVNAQTSNVSDLRSSVFKIITISASPDYRNPWNDFSPSQSFGTGFYIGQKLILTNAHVVAEHRYVMVQKDGEARPVRAKVLFQGHDCDLAILSVDDAAFFQNIKPLTLGGVPRLLSPVQAIGYPVGGEQLSITDGVVSRMGFNVYSHDGFAQHFLIQVDSAINPGNSGGPVVQGGKVVGVAFQGRTTAQSTGYIIPTPVVERFLTDISDGKYDGHPFHGLSLQKWSMTNPSLRKFMKKSDVQGILVADVAEYEGVSKVLQAGDLITEMEGKAIGVDGKIEYYRERVDFRVLIDQKQVGENVSMKIVRNGKPMEVGFKAGSRRKHYKRNTVYKKRPPYAVVGGMVFTPLTRNLLETWGKSWYLESPLSLRRIHAYYEHSELAGRDDVIVYVQKLGSRINSYVQTPKFAIVKSVQGKEPKSFSEFVELTQNYDGKFLKIDYFFDEIPTFLSQESRKEAEAEILQSFRIQKGFVL